MSRLRASDESRVARTSPACVSAVTCCAIACWLTCSAAASAEAVAGPPSRSRLRMARCEIGSCFARSGRVSRSRSRRHLMTTARRTAMGSAARILCMAGNLTHYTSNLDKLLAQFRGSDRPGQCDVHRAPLAAVLSRTHVQRIRHRPLTVTMGFVDRLLRDARFAMRGFRRTPGFVVTTVAILGLGIGMSVAMFTVFRTVLLRTLPVVDQDRAVIMWTYRDDPNSD